MKLFQDVQVKENTDCILWYAEEKSPTKILLKFHEKYGKHSNALNNKTILKWIHWFKKSGTISQLKRRQC